MRTKCDKRKRSQRAKSFMSGLPFKFLGRERKKLKMKEKKIRNRVRVQRYSEME